MVTYPIKNNNKNMHIIYIEIIYLPSLDTLMYLVLDIPIWRNIFLDRLKKILSLKNK